MAITERKKEMSIPIIAVIVPAPNPGPMYNARLFIFKNNSTLSIF